MKKKIITVLKYIVLCLILTVVILAIWNCICAKHEQKKLEDVYGQVVTVDGRRMVVDIKGEEHETTIILLPGWGSPSPILEFLPLAEQLSQKYRVITVEPFGYGLSDISGEERTVDAVTEELHECIRELGCEKYYLMAHSLSGLYSLYWANTYPQEVQGFIGIDPSVPKQSDDEPFPISVATLNKLAAYLQKVKNTLGITRIQSINHPERAIYADLSYDYSEKQLEIYRILTMDCAYNRGVMDEVNHMEEMLDVVRNMSFPESVPVLQFVSGVNCESMENWEQLHKDVITETKKSEVLVLDGGHYLHFERLPEIVEKVNTWIQE